MTPSSRSRPTLTVCVLTQNSEQRLGQMLADHSQFADEIVVGVDDASADQTYRVASMSADVVFRFQHTGIPEPARMLFLDFARTDWLLVLDDDERMDGMFGPLLPELLSVEHYTHYWFPRRWIVSLEPLTYVRRLPWFPDWQPRLFRNDRRIVWHPPALHSRYQVIGTGCYENRTAILHYERVMTDDEARARKLSAWRRLGGRQYEEFYKELIPSPQILIEAPPPQLDPAAKGGRRARGRLIEGTRRCLRRSALPPWGARLEVRLPETLQGGEQTFVEVRAENVGTLSWYPPGRDWPRLNFSYHVLDPSMRVHVWDGARTPLGRVLKPGESAAFLVAFRPPKAPGDYLVEWDMVSEGECWFAQCGSAPARSFVHVLAPEGHREPWPHRLRQKAVRTAYRWNPMRPRLTRPVFIVGCGRSGTTVLGTMLGQHPELAYVNEPRLIWAHEPATDIWSSHAESQGGRLCLTAADVAPFAAVQIIRDFAAEVRRAGAIRLIEKLPANSFRIGFLDALFPDSLFLHLIRDGRDVAASIARRAARGEWFGHGEYKWRQLVAHAESTGIGDLVHLCTNDALRGLLEWRLAISAVRRSLSELPDRRWIEVRYEDFVAQPVEACQQLEAFIGVEPSGLTLAFAEREVICPRPRSNPPVPPSGWDRIVGPLLNELRPHVMLSADHP
jgi:hypothetical protein